MSNKTIKYHIISAVCIVVGILAGHALADDSVMPWKTNRPIVDVKRELIYKTPVPGACAVLQYEYVGPKLELLERRCGHMLSDFLAKETWRVSKDNGRTWSEAWPMPDSAVYHSGVKFYEGFSPKAYDPRSGALVAVWLRQVEHAGLCHNFCYWRISRDCGRTWSEPKQLCYEPAETFDPAKPLAAGFLEKNQGYFGSNIIIHSNGTLIHCLAHANAPNDQHNSRRAWRMGSICFIGRWDTAAGDYLWEAGKPVEISPAWSSRGLMEPELAELKDGRVLVIWRGSNTKTTPGRKWFSVSTDGGRTLAPVAELRYDDGSRFYSPSSFHKMIRHSRSGKLYWVGNICPKPPKANWPRYPLIIAEVDEDKLALKKNTVTMIDDRREGESSSLQLSNFSLIENRETHNIEVYLGRMAAKPGDSWAGDAYKYTLALTPQPSEEK
ncbi:MAG: exo-alpha-sialidase [Pirellulales bacterium]|nr:exo-alpha-sialidase [Pirellulales bacterium]